jgi:hypothetical protein
MNVLAGPGLDDRVRFDGKGSPGGRRRRREEMEGEYMCTRFKYSRLKLFFGT